MAKLIPAAGLTRKLSDGGSTLYRDSYVDVPKWQTVRCAGMYVHEAILCDHSNIRVVQDRGREDCLVEPGLRHASDAGHAVSSSDLCRQTNNDKGACATTVAGSHLILPIYHAAHALITEAT